jgi:membrane-bound lytic murein transglycosylase B
VRTFVMGTVGLAIVVVLVSALATWFSRMEAAGVVPTRVSAPAIAPPGPGAVVPQLNLALPGRQQPQLVEWAATLSSTVAVPAVALQAYGYAAAKQALANPECGIGWSTLAGIGAVESRHGSYGGARMDGMGRALPPIIGIALDGGPDVAAIADTDNGALDGDPNVDRAVGPMQFIPETWRRWGVDADGDGVADPNDLNDAALTAARYLCSRDPHMTTAQGWHTALFSYNRSDVYAKHVLQYAANYAAGLSG